MNEILILFLQICEIQKNKSQCFHKSIECIETNMGKKSYDDIILICVKKIKEA